jgi:hypothetical protein
MQERKMTRVVNRKRYDTETATLLADDVYWDGSNMERRGRNLWLYRTPNGAYFTVSRSQWQGEQDRLTPQTREEAIDLYENALPEHAVDYAEAFPGVEIQEA